MTQWVLLAFEKRGDELIEELTIEGLGEDDIRLLTGQPASDPMYNSYPVSEAQGGSLEAATGHSLDFSRYDYFVEGKFG